MAGVILPADTANAIDRASRELSNGRLVIIPTDTVYGVSAAISHPEAVADIYRAKGRPIDKPIALLIDRIEDVEDVAESVPALARLLIARFWPGGLTLILPRKPGVPDVVAAGGPTIAVRMPDQSVARAVIRRLGQPLPTTSANLSGHPSPRTAQEAASQLGDAVAVVLDAGPTPGGIDSTVLDPTTTPPSVLREGAISVSDIESAIGMPVARPS